MPKDETQSGPGRPAPRRYWRVPEDEAGVDALVDDVIAVLFGDDEEHAEAPGPRARRARRQGDVVARVRFWEVRGDDLNADGGSIELLRDGRVRVPASLEFALDLAAPFDMREQPWRPTRPSGGFAVLERTPSAVIAEPVAPDGWDGLLWLDRVRHHFRTPYLRPGDVETDEPLGEAGETDAPGSSGAR